MIPLYSLIKLFNLSGSKRKLCAYMIQIQILTHARLYQYQESLHEKKSSKMIALHSITKKIQPLYECVRRTDALPDPDTSNSHHRFYYRQSLREISSEMAASYSNIKLFTLFTNIREEIMRLRHPETNNKLHDRLLI